MNTRLYLINWDRKAVREEIINAVADKLIPQLRALIEQAAQEVAGKYGPDSPFAVSTAEELLLQEVAAFLPLNGHERWEYATMRDLTPEHVRAWLEGDI